MQAITTVMGKVAVMLILIALGCIITKMGMLTSKGAAEMTTLLIKFVTPCLIVNSFLGAEHDLKASEMLLAMAVSGLAILLSLGLSYLFFKKEPPERKKVLRFSAVYSNAGFMGIPLIQGILGAKGVVFGSFFIVMFNIICWTHGYRMMSSGKLNWKAAIFNPGIIGLMFGLPIYFLRISLPVVIAEPVGFLAGLNTPLSMIVIGSYVAKISLKDFLSDLSVYKTAVLRLVVAPALYLLCLLVIRPAPDLFVSSMIQAAAPVAANAVLFSVEYHCDAKLASETVAVSTVLSIVTIPIFTILAQLACGVL